MISLEGATVSSILLPAPMILVFGAMFVGGVRLRHIGRAQNLAGIALARRHPR